MATPTLLVDAHVHVASGDEQRYPRNPTGAGSNWWQHASGVEELVADLDACDIDRAVVVQAIGVYGYDCRYAADVSARSDRFAFVGAIDMAGDDVATSFEQLDNSTELAGLRLFGVSHAGSEWLSNGAGATVWRLAAREGCVLVPTLFNDALPALRELIEQYPDVDVALDHCAFPDLGGPGALALLLELAELPRLHLKVTSHNLDTDGDPAEFLAALVDAYGASRLCWGSDHPQHGNRTYPELIEIARDASRDLSDADQASFLGGNSLALWWPGSDSEREAASTDTYRSRPPDARRRSSDAC